MTNKIALVTGSSSGIGKSIVTELAKNGTEVIINFSKSKDKAEEVRNKIISSGGKACIFQADITKEKEVVKLFEFIKVKFNRLDILINNAGMYIPSFIEDQNIGDWDLIFNLNIKSKLLCTKYAVPLLKESSVPRIINISTRAGADPITESASYCCAATSINMLTQVSALELAKYKIKVNTISPGLTKTPMTEKFDTEREYNEYAKNNPSGRIGLPQDIANLVIFLVSEKADFINGENINVSGGIILK